ncbi:putative membrane protein [Halomicronema hongdechloris C2206]|uniref:Membrane protein n=1 Tax=Halomicronema hongdechloris C2206 TaxID=1641165 RepID=A0A1Z3HSH5_9CYAN|nr:LysE family translocator [Halomicronema hongdechloris]ASC73248.1 putative membrane protein [Halomicronema hongdechloris C2206]
MTPPLTMTGRHIATLFGTMLVLAVVPGPSDVAVVARSLISGFTQGLIMVVGIVMADLLFIVLAVFSLAEVADSLGALFVIVNYGCGLYLIGLGIHALRSRPHSIEVSDVRQYPGYSSFLVGLLITLADPKAILFYMGLLPAFVELSTITVLDILVIMLIATTVVGGVKGTYACLANQAKGVFKNSRLRQRLESIAGCVLLGIGLFIVLQPHV